MILANGDMVQYGKIKEGTVGEYLNKLSNYVDSIERDIKRAKRSSVKAK